MDFFVLWLLLVYIRFCGIWLSPRQVIDANTHRQLLIVATSKRAGMRYAGS